jgi:hypothetical protein
LNQKQSKKRPAEEPSDNWQLKTSKKNGASDIFPAERGYHLNIGTEKSKLKGNQALYYLVNP